MANVGLATMGLAASLLLASMSAHAQVSGTLRMGDPGFYGQIDIGQVPQPPQLISPRPVIIQPDRNYRGPPLYLHVPPGYERRWDRYCARYGACGRPVYFVNDRWYRDTYVREYRRRHPR